MSWPWVILCGSVPVLAFLLGMSLAAFMNWRDER